MQSDGTPRDLFKGLASGTLLGAKPKAVMAVAALVVAGLAGAGALYAGVGPQANLSAQRIFPEAHETNDFVSYEEALKGLGQLEIMEPDYIEVRNIGESYGFENARTGEHDRFPVLLVEVTNEKSAIPQEEKPKLIVQLSIHGNEKGAREGGLRVIEDLVRNIPAEDMPEGYPQKYHDMLDRVMLLFVFPNPDGWAHEAPEYRHNDCNYVSVGDVETQNYCRGNANGSDINRDHPTKGWVDTSDRAHALSEPETPPVVRALESYENLVYASDIHGMLHPADSGVLFDSGSKPIAGECDVEAFGQNACVREGHFVLGLMPEAQYTPEQNARNVFAADYVKANLNGMAAREFPEWDTVPESGVWGGEFMEWGTVWDTIGYLDSGFSGSYYGQFLGVTGFDFEMAYNHITFDNHYTVEMNRIHIASVRTITASFMDLLERHHDLTVRSEDKVAYLTTDHVVTSADGPAQNGPAEHATVDDRYQQPYAVSSMSFLEGVRDAAGPNTVFEPITYQDAWNLDTLNQYDAVVVTGDAYRELQDRPFARAQVLKYAADGGRVVLTDSAVRILFDQGLLDWGDIGRTEQYAGYIDLVEGDPLTEGTRGIARQTYEPIPLGFTIQEDSAPVWHVDRAAWEGMGGRVAGTTGGANQVTLGEVPFGDGEVVFIGALLPTPTEAYYHPYGLTGHAVTYTGYQVFYNAVGAEAVYQ